MTMRKSMTVLLMATLIGLSGCSSLAFWRDAEEPEVPEAERVTSTAGAYTDTATAERTLPPVTEVQSAGAPGPAGAVGPAGSLGSQRIFYFDYDSSDIRPEFVDVVAAHGRFLSGNTSIRVRLEGHTDERGSPEYNIGLGERRAQTVKRALLLQGVSESQIATVSYGEERPAVAGSDETAYAKNRRVEIVYIN